LNKDLWLHALAAVLCGLLAVCASVAFTPALPAMGQAQPMEREGIPMENQKKGIVSRDAALYGPETCARELAELHRRYPGVTALAVVGTSHLGQPIYALKMGNDGADQRVLVQAGMHGREWINAQVVMAQMEDYLSGEAYAPLLSEACFLFVPMINPDGVRIAQEGADWIEDKAARALVADAIARSGEPHTQWKANGRGVDLNRNFDAHFAQQTGERETAGPAYAFYRGECAASEPETQALTQLTLEFAPTVTLSYHSRGEEVYWYFYQQGEALERDERIALRLAALAGYACDRRGEARVDSFGGYKDWCVEKLGIPAFTIETGRNEWGVPVPAARFAEIYAACRDLTAEAAREA
jgi:g-D-glutamyl-meso-diaminopimelate peptidase